MEPTSFFFDMDSTLLQVEAGDEVADISLAEFADDAERKRLLTEWKRITDLGMNGEMSLLEAIRKRLELIPLRKRHMEAVLPILASRLTNGMSALIHDLHANGCDCWILTASIGELALPVAQAFGIPKERVRANRAVWEGDRLTAYAPDILLGHSGKAAALKEIRARNLTHPRVVMVGDGIGDLLAHELGGADEFFGYGEHAVRPEVLKRAKQFFRSVPEMREFLGL